MRFFALLILVCLSVRAQVDLDYQFAKRTSTQVGGSCHIFAATALFEAACYRATGKHVKLSDGLLYNQHLMHQMYDGHSMEAFFSGIEDEYEAGNPKASLQRIMAGKACTDAEYPLDKDFFNSLRAITLKAKQDLQEWKSSNWYDQEIDRLKKELNLSHKGFAFNVGDWKRLNRLHDLLDARERKYNFKKMDLRGRTLELLRAQNESHVTKTSDPDLQRCLKLDFVIERKIDPSPGEMKKLLKAKLPFACESSYVHLPDRNNGMILGGNASHVAVVNGYRGDDDFQVRDSNFGHSTWGWLIKKCEAILIFKVKKR